MLFTFNKFWKTLFFVVGAWGCWVIAGYHFTSITLLALIIASNFKNDSSVF